MGEMQVPADAYYGAQTARAVENFPISSLRFSRQFIKVESPLRLPQIDLIEVLCVSLRYHTRNDLRRIFAD